MTTLESTTKQRKEGLFYKQGINHMHGGIIRELGFNGFGVLSAIASFANDKGECFPSQDTLAEMCGVQRKAINRIVKNLCEYRTADGKAVLSKNTVRQGYDKTRTFYTVLPSAGMAFGSNMVSNEVVPFKGIASEVDGGCVVSSEVVPFEGIGVVPFEGEGCPPNGTLTKAINKSHINESHKEQEGKKAASFESEKNTSSMTNNIIPIVDIGKESNKEKPNQVHGDIVGTSERERIASSIVANGRNKEEGGTGAAAVSVTSKPSERDSLLARIEANEAAKQAAAIKAKESRRKESASMSQAIARISAHGHATTSQEYSTTKRPSEPRTPYTGRVTPFDAMSFEQLLSMTDDEARRMGEK